MGGRRPILKGLRARLNKAEQGTLPGCQNASGEAAGPSEQRFEPGTEGGIGKRDVGLAKSHGALFRVPPFQEAGSD